MNAKPTYGLPATAYYGGFANFLVPSRMNGFDEQTDSGIEALGRWAIYDVACRRPHYLDELMRQAREVFEGPVKEGEDRERVIRLRLGRWQDTPDESHLKAAIRYWVRLHKIYHVRDKYDPNNRVHSDAPLIHCLKWVFAAVGLPNLKHSGLDEEQCAILIANASPKHAARMAAKAAEEAAAKSVAEASAKP
jgi:hypothetical protein